MLLNIIFLQISSFLRRFVTILFSVFLYPSFTLAITPVPTPDPPKKVHVIYFDAATTPSIVKESAEESKRLYTDLLREYFQSDLSIMERAFSVLDGGTDSNGVSLCGGYEEGSKYFLWNKEMYKKIGEDVQESERPLKRNLLSAIESVSRNSKPGDKVVFYISTHGGFDNLGQYLLEEEYTRFNEDYTKNGNLPDAISINDLAKSFKGNLQHTNNIIVLSACYSGIVLNNSPGRFPGCLSPFELNNFSLLLNSSVITACRGGELATTGYDLSLLFGLGGSIQRLGDIDPIGPNYYIQGDRYRGLQTEYIRTKHVDLWQQEPFWLGSNVFSQTYNFLLEEFPDFRPMSSIRYAESEIPLHCRSIP